MSANRHDLFGERVGQIPSPAAICRWLFEVEKNATSMRLPPQPSAETRSRSQVVIERDILMSEDQNGFRNRICSRRRSWIDPGCHNETYEFDQLHCQPRMLGNQSPNTAWLPRYSCIASISNSKVGVRRCTASTVYAGTVPIAGMLAASLSGAGMGARVDSGAYGKRSNGGGFGRGDHDL